MSKTYYPGVKVNTNISADKLKYKMIIDNFTESGEIIFQTNTEKNVPTDYKIIEEITTSNNPMFYRVKIELYRLFDESCPLIKVKECFLSSSLTEFTSSNKCEEFHPLEYKETTHQLKKLDKNNRHCEAIISITYQKRIFETKEYPSPKPGEEENPKDPFSKINIAKELSFRLQNWLYIKNSILNWKSNGEINSIQNNLLPHQRLTSLCGVAAYFYSLFRFRPDLYRKSTIELWTYGKTKIENLYISAKDSKKPKNFFDSDEKPRLSGLDWITMGSLRNTENLTLDYDDLNLSKSSPKKEGLTGMTTPSEIESWLKKSGMNVINLASVTLKNGNTIKDINIINNYAKNGYGVIQLVSPFYLLTSNHDTSLFELHWWVWESPLINKKNNKIINETSDLNDEIDVLIFSWGELESIHNLRANSKQKKILLKDFMYASRGAIIFK